VQQPAPAGKRASEWAREMGRAQHRTGQTAVGLRLRVCGKGGKENNRESHSLVLRV